MLELSALWRVRGKTDQRGRDWGDHALFKVESEGV